MKKKVVILGGGESGVGAALLAKAKGYEVFLSDKGVLKDNYANTLKEHGVPFESGKHTEDKILGVPLVIKSPGIPDNAPLVEKLKSEGADIISEIEFAAGFSKAKFIAITGSNGKTTTTLLTYHLLKKLGLNVGLAGNIGESLAKQVIDDSYDYYVLELSSFQLDGMYKFRAHIAVLLNITPDHLDRYDYNFQNYVDSKFRIIQNMRSTDFFVANVDDPVIREELTKREVVPFQLSASLKKKVLNGAYLSDDSIMISVDNHINRLFSLAVDQLPLRGKHNVLNTMAAVLVATVLGQNPERFQEAMSDFKNAAHRLELAGEVNAIRFINDSKATNVDSVYYALDSFKEPIVWIAGGIDKGNDYSQIDKLVKERVKALVCLGTDNSKLHNAFDDKIAIIQDSHSMDEAVDRAYALAKPGDVVLLSPACASFDLFKNYEDRGDQFKKAVSNLIQRAGIQR